MESGFGYIVVLRKGKTSSPYELDQGEHTIGSSADSNIRLKFVNPLLLETHAIIRVNHVGVVTVINKSTAAPIRVNGKTAFKPTILRHKDKFQVLEKEFQYFNEKLKDEPEDSVIFAQEKRKLLASSRKSVMILSKTPVKSPTYKTKTPLKTPSRRLLNRSLGASLKKSANKTTTVRTPCARSLSSNPNEAPNTPISSHTKNEQGSSQNSVRPRGNQDTGRIDNSNLNADKDSSTNAHTDASPNLIDFEKTSRIRKANEPGNLENVANNNDDTPSRRSNNLKDDSLGHINTLDALQTSRGTSDSPISPRHHSRRTGAFLEMSTLLISKKDTTVGNNVSINTSEHCTHTDYESNLDEDGGTARSSKCRRSSRSSRALNDSLRLQEVSRKISDVNESITGTPAKSECNTVSRVSFLSQGDTETIILNNEDETTQNFLKNDDLDKANDSAESVISLRLSLGSSEATQRQSVTSLSDEKNNSSLVRKSTSFSQKNESDNIGLDQELGKSLNTSRRVSKRRSVNTFSLSVQGSDEPMQNISRSIKHDESISNSRNSEGEQLSLEDVGNISSSQTSTVQNSRETTLNIHGDVGIHTAMGTFDESTQKVNFSGSKNNSNQSEKCTTDSVFGNYEQMKPISIQDDSEEILSPVQPLLSRKSAGATGRRSSKRSSLKSEKSESSSLNTASLVQSMGSVISVSSESFSSFKRGNAEAQNDSDDIEIDVVNFTMETEAPESMKNAGVGAGQAGTPVVEARQSGRPSSAVHMFDDVTCTSTPFHKPHVSKDDHESSSTGASSNSLLKTPESKVFTISSTEVTMKSLKVERSRSASLGVADISGTTKRRSSSRNRTPKNGEHNCISCRHSSVKRSRSLSTTSGVLEDSEVKVIAKSGIISEAISPLEKSSADTPGKASLHRESHIEDETPKSHIKPTRRSSKANQSAYNPVLEDITPVTPEKLQVSGFTETFKTPINTPGLFESIRKSVVRSRKRPRDSNGSVLRESKKAKIDYTDENEQSQAPLHDVATDLVKRRQKSPLNRLSDFEGVKNLMKTPPESPKNDLRNIPNRVMSPKRQNSPRNDLTAPFGVKKLLRSPKTQKGPVNDLTNVSGVANMFNVSGIDDLHHDSDIENSVDLFTKLTGKRPVRAYCKSKSLSPAKAESDGPVSRKTMGDLAVYSPRVQQWVDEHANCNLSNEDQPSFVSESDAVGKHESKKRKRRGTEDVADKPVFRSRKARSLSLKKSPRDANRRKTQWDMLETNLLQSKSSERLPKQPRRKPRIGRSMSPKKISRAKGKRRKTQGDNLDVDNWTSKQTSDQNDLIQCIPTDQAENVPAQPERKPRIGRSVSPKKIGQKEGKRRKTHGDNLMETPDVDNWIFRQKSDENGLIEGTPTDQVENVLESMAGQPKRKPRIGRSVSPKKMGQKEGNRRKTHGDNLMETPDVDNWISRQKSDENGLIEGTPTDQVENILESMAGQPKRKPRIGRSVSPKKMDQKEGKRRKTQGDNLSATPNVNNWKSEEKPRSRNVIKKSPRKVSPSNVDQTVQIQTPKVEITYSATKTPEIVESTSPSSSKEHAEENEPVADKSKIALTSRPKRGAKAAAPVEVDRVEEPKRLHRRKQLSTEDVVESPLDTSNRRTRKGKTENEVKATTRGKKTVDSEVVQSPIRRGGRRGKAAQVEPRNEDAEEVMGSTNAKEGETTTTRGKKAVMPEVVQSPVRRGGRRAKAAQVGLPNEEGKEVVDSIATKEGEAVATRGKKAVMSDVVQSPIRRGGRRAKAPQVELPNEEVVQSPVRRGGRRGKAALVQLPNDEGQDAKEGKAPQKSNFAQEVSQISFASPFPSVSSIVKTSTPVNSEITLKRRSSTLDEHDEENEPVTKESRVEVRSRPKRGAKAATPVEDERVEAPKRLGRRKKLISTEASNTSTVESPLDISNRRTRKGKAQNQEILIEEKTRGKLAVASEIAQSPVRRGGRRAKAAQVELPNEEGQETSQTKVQFTSPSPVSQEHDGANDSVKSKIEVRSRPKRGAVAVEDEPVEAPKRLARGKKAVPTEDTAESPLEIPNRRTRKGKAQNEEVTPEVVRSPVKRGGRKTKKIEDDPENTIDEGEAAEHVVNEVSGRTRSGKTRRAPDVAEPSSKPTRGRKGKKDVEVMPVAEEERVPEMVDSPRAVRPKRGKKVHFGVQEDVATETKRTLRGKK